ncbi:MAG: MarR family transcriptional regulator [Anaerolineales bacterium]|nr:MarR family transcriptional regulator [Anaerolineales bacterium]
MQNKTAASQEQLIAVLQRLEGLGLGRMAAKDLELSLSQLGLLFAVQRHPGIRVNELAQLLHLSAPTVSVGLRKLEGEGWLLRQADPQDRRSLRLHLTEKARAFAKRAQQFQRKQIGVLLSGLEAEEQAQLVHLLNKAITSLENRADQTKES